MKQNKQKEWYEQWNMLQDNELFLFKEWIYPNLIEDFKDKEVLECGCGGGQHTSFIAPYAKSITAVDLNTIDIAQKSNNKYNNIQFVEDDIATMNLGKQFDIVFSIGVVHHTNNPDLTVENLKKHVKPNGKLILWVYSKEGNYMVYRFVEPIRKLFLTNISRNGLLKLSKIITFLIYVPIYTIYLLPFSFLPFFEYFQNFRKLSFYRNTLNVFDKLNAPQVQFISKARVEKWMEHTIFSEVNISPYKGVSWRITGIKK